jgi:hypothetical protein
MATLVYLFSSLNRGNLLEILRWCSQTDPISREILEDTNKNATYLSHHIQNELISIIANQIRSQISGQVINFLQHFIKK